MEVEEEMKEARLYTQHSLSMPSLTMWYVLISLGRWTMGDGGVIKRWSVFLT